MSKKVTARKGEREAKPRVAETAANAHRTVGSAIYKIARTWHVCEWCGQRIMPGELYVAQERYLRLRSRWTDRGPRHDICWGIEGRSGGILGSSTVKEGAR